MTAADQTACGGEIGLLQDLPNGFRLIQVRFQQNLAEQRDGAGSVSRPNGAACTQPADRIGGIGGAADRIYGEGQASEPGLDLALQVLAAVEPGGQLTEQIGQERKPGQLRQGHRRQGEIKVEIDRTRRLNGGPQDADAAALLLGADGPEGLCREIGAFKVRDGGQRIKAVRLLLPGGKLRLFGPDLCLLFLAPAGGDPRQLGGLSLSFFPAEGVGGKQGQSGKAVFG